MEGYIVVLMEECGMIFRMRGPGRSDCAEALGLVDGFGGLICVAVPDISPLKGQGWSSMVTADCN